MAGARVCIETSVPGAHVTTRTDAASVYRREKTREWWEERINLCKPYTSVAVLAEAEKVVDLRPRPGSRQG